MTTQTPCADGSTRGRPLGAVPTHWQDLVVPFEALPDFVLVEPLTVPSIAESAEAVIEDHLDASLSAAPALLDGLAATAPEAGAPNEYEARATSLDEYAKAVLYNGLGHYQAARAAAQRACERDDFTLLEGALAELVEASVRSGSRECAMAALRRLEARVQVSRSEWAMGVAACARALVSDDDRSESGYLEAIDRLSRTCARVALGRVRLLYGEWLRRQGRRVDAREQLALAHRVFSDVGLSGFDERTRRELLATGHTVRKRTDDTRRNLTAQEAHIAQLAACGCTNPEIGQRLFISPRTVEWHLRKVFTKLGIGSRKELKAMFPRVARTSVPS